jgi:menaquinone-dependent protoporphyrinogen oxidase
MLESTSAYSQGECDMSENKAGLSRRQFMMGMAGVSVVAIGGTGYWALRQPELTFIETSYSGAGKRMLVAYGSQYGSTGGVADAIGKAINDQGVAVDVRRVNNELDISAYDAAIIGAPVISSEWMSDAVDFVSANREALADIPTAVFLTGMELALTQDIESSQASMAALLENTVTPIIQPIEYGLFAGALDYSNMTPAMRVLYRVFSEDDTDGDYRDFSAIYAWAEAIAPRLFA